MPSLVLASSSPRRAALLSESGFEFDVAPPRVAEKFDAALTLRELTLGTPFARVCLWHKRVPTP
ncbi:MAG: hypothetical protein DMF00_06935 [Verrucomicrobia bacterium]|nr:MAG: hypothetical protein DMF00_06935 [Verrucomicrobiota bacterium]